MAADLIVQNANIHTVDMARPTAQALLIRDGRIVMLGNQTISNPVPSLGRRS